MEAEDSNSSMASAKAAASAAAAAAATAAAKPDEKGCSDQETVKKEERVGEVCIFKLNVQSVG